MTDIKKTAKSKAKAKKLQLNKETLKDLSAKEGGHIRGGNRALCTNGNLNSC